ncbi:MAG: hypothetical protein LBU80_07990 [Rikenellaceae bacterium]|jgi:hypothetical protein|nr:hypothetical protein [Rikenellaceae bacterium]
MKIDQNNYEQYALDYLEGNLAGDIRKAFEAFLDAHPEEASGVRSLFDGMPRLEPEPWVTYPDKQALKRAVPMYETAPHRTLARRWIYYACAAVAVVAVSVLGVGLYRTQPVDDPSTSSMAQAPATVIMQRVARRVFSITDRQAARFAVSRGATSAGSDSEKLAAARAVSRPATIPAKPDRENVTAQTAVAQLTPASMATNITVDPTSTPDDADPEEAFAVTPLIPLLTGISTVRPSTSVVLPEGPIVREMITERTSDFDSAVDPATGLTHGQVLLAMGADAPAETAAGERFRRSRGGKFFRSLVQPLVEPLDVLSPVTVYRENEQRIIEVGSYIVSRKRVNN